MAAATSQIYSIGEYKSDYLSLPMASNVTIYGGTFVCTDGSGNANPAADTSGFIFAGVADQVQAGSYVNPTSGSVQVQVQGPMHFKDGLLICPATSPAQSWVGTRVFIKDSQTVVQAGGSSNKVTVGTVVAVLNTGTSGAVLVDTRNRATLAAT